MRPLAGGAIELHGHRRRAGGSHHRQGPTQNRSSCAAHVTPHPPEPTAACLLRLAPFNGALLRADGAELFGRGNDGEPSLPDCLGTGSLLTEQLDLADSALRPTLLQLARDGRCSEPGHPERQYRFGGRLFFTSDKAVSEFDRVCQLIRVPPLRVRLQDLGKWIRHGVRQKALSLGWAAPPGVSDEMVKRLQSYSFFGNVSELLELIERAFRYCAASHPAILPDDVFWTSRRGPREPAFISGAGSRCCRT